MREAMEVADSVWGQVHHHGRIYGRDVILSDRREVRAETVREIVEKAKAAVNAKAYSKTSGHGESDLYVPLHAAIAALDALLKEEE